jgi:hypothetical protein
MTRGSVFIQAFIVAATLLQGLVRGSQGEAQSDWVAVSNAQVQPALAMMARYNPEAAGRFGLDGFDEGILDLGPKIYERMRDDTRAVLTELEQRLKGAEHPKVKQDLELLIQVLKDRMARNERAYRLMLPYIKVPGIAFGGIRALVDDNVAKSRHASAVVRLKKYVGLEGGGDSIVALAKARIAERFEIDGLIGPYRVQVEKDIANSDRYVQGIAELLEGDGLEGWQEAHKQLADQIKSYNEWLEAEMLPRCRDDHRLPPELYLDRLESFGVRMSLEELIERGQAGFMEIRQAMQAMAKRIAAERGWEKDDYRDVIRALKREQLETDEILPVYRERLREIEAIVRRERIVTLPEREARIRFASEAESVRSSAPNMQPPRLIGNTGEYGEFVIPLRNPSAASDEKMDDFLHDAISWTLTAHEARPGHEMQFSAMIENGVSITRAVFAFNSGNVEGWGLYAEAIMQEHLPLEGQFFTLHMRLLRAARAFLDPMLNLGRMQPDEAKAFLMRELVLSEPMAAQEVDRYTFRLPGQAPSYYYGLMRLEALRTEVELLLAGDFDQQSFHDFILAQGLLPPDLLRQAVLEEYVPAVRGG